jgi:Zn finger protein HypA/HybF involved in hydrogenase expression
MGKSFYTMPKHPRLSAIIDHLLQQPTRIASVHIVVGESIPFSDQQIHAQWDESPLTQFPLTIRRVPAEQQCMACFERYHPTRAEVSCPHCGSVGAKIIAGEEFYLESIEEQNG